MAKPISYTVTDGKLVLTLEVCEEGGFFVTSPFNSDVKTQADTLEEAFDMARDVIAIFEKIRSEQRKAGGSKKAALMRIKQKVS